MEKFEYAQNQKDYFKEIKYTNNNIVLTAVPGGAKTSTMLASLEMIPSTKKIIFLAFNKAIVEEIMSKCKLPNVTVKTLHSAGFSSMIKMFGSKVNNYKYHKFLNDSIFLLTDTITIDTSESEISQYKSTVLKLLDFARASLVETESELEKLALEHDVTIEKDEVKVVLKLADWGLKHCKEVDFADMLWIPNKKDLPLQQYDVVFIDEFQDMSISMVNLMLKMVAPNGRFICAGDERQLINYFACSDRSSFDKVRALPNTVSLPLSVCYRCDKNIIDKVNTVFGDESVQPREGAGEGNVEVIQDMTKIKSGDMILSRVTSPLVSLCMKFITNGIPAYVKGREIGESLAALVKKTKQQECSTMFEILNNELYKMSVKIAKKNEISIEEAKNEYAYIALQDKIECLQNLSFGCVSTKELLTKISELFKDNSKGICHSTIHKSKGLQADNVFIIALDKLPLKRAMTTEGNIYSEKCLEYVAYSRAKHNLYLVNCDIKDIEIIKNI